MDANEIKAAEAILRISTVKLDTDVPKGIGAHSESANTLVEKLKSILGDNTHGAYFESSIKRYQHYFAVLATLLPSPPGKVLDVGNAPGHVGIGLSLLGHHVTGLNLNREWRATYPSTEWIEKLNVMECDIEKSPLPFLDNLFDAVLFTEVLEHVAITDPAKICAELRRVLRPGGLLLLSTPNVCNISNLFALIKGTNIFWPPELFYGGTDRHNREYTPEETYRIVEKAGFKDIRMYGMNFDSNWRAVGNEYAYELLGHYGDKHPLLRNTTVILATK